jgi:two-component system, cell cycle response regulator DivK
MTQQTILYIEDNPENRLLVKRVLEAEGYVVIEADSGMAGLSTAVATRPDLVLMDINLPEIDGYELTRRLKRMEHLAGVPVVAMTANVMKGDREKTLAAGCDGYIQKPIDVDQLPIQIARFLKVKLP